MEYLFSGRLRELVGVAEDVAEQIAGQAVAVDREAVWPAHSFAALKAAGLMGLNAPERLGGEQQGMVGLVAVTEVLARACSSSAICYAMHCVATAVVAAKATPAQEARYLLPIAAGEHVSTLALSESGTGAHFYLPQTRLERGPDGFEISGLKQFVTSGAHADSYIVSAVTPEVGGEVGDFSCLVLDADQDGMTWLPPWQGLGMRGNSSRGLRLERVRAPFERLLGEPGDQIWYAFEVIAPYFLMAMSATYLGVASAALRLALQHLRERSFAHSGEALADLPTVQAKVAELWAAVERSRSLVYHAAYLGDSGDPGALAAVLSSKAEVAETAVWVTNEAMTLCGGAAYRDNSDLARLLRDARASHVMSPTTALLRQWTGRALLGRPLL